MLVPLSTATCVSAGLTAGVEDSLGCVLEDPPVCVRSECVVEDAELVAAPLLDPPPSELTTSTTAITPMITAPTINAVARAGDLPPRE